MGRAWTASVVWARREMRKNTTPPSRFARRVGHPWKTKGARFGAPWMELCPIPLYQVEAVFLRFCGELYFEWRQDFARNCEV